MDQPKNSLNVPMAILAAGILIALALFFSGSKSDGTPNNPVKPGKTATTSINLPPVTEVDHLLGDANAPIVNVEYSDLECYFCRLFEPTAERLREEYGKKGQVAWVYRHFPLEDLHPRAKKAAVASECIAELGGNTKFWSFVSEVFKTSDPRNGSLEKLNMSEIAKNLGVNQSAFDTCLASTKFDQRIADSVSKGIGAGVTGTPRSFMVLKKALSESEKETILSNTAEYLDQQGRPLVTVSSDGKIVSLNGALPYEVFKMVIDLAL